MFTEEQLELIYGAVKEMKQKCYVRTLMNTQEALMKRDLDRKRIKKYNDIMNIINITTGNEPEGI